MELLVAFVAGVLVTVAATLARHRSGDRGKDAGAADAQVGQRLRRDRAVLIQTISHEVRTPLTIIRGVGRVLSQNRVDDHRRTVLLNSLERATDDLDEKLQLVMAASETITNEDRVPTQRITVVWLVDQVSASLARDGATERVRWHGPDDLVIVSVSSAVRAALRALVHNALRFSPADTPVEVRGWREKETVVLEIRDHGAGIDPDFADRAMEPFTQGDQSTTRKQNGLGLGLAVARNLTVQIGGSLTLGNAEDGGALATLRLPHRRDIDREARRGIRAPGPAGV